MSEKSDNEPPPEPEDLPNDFFDDFNKAEFIEGLSVIDSWDDNDGSNRKIPRIDKAALDSVQDLRELIHKSDAPDNDQGNHKKSTGRPNKSGDKLRKNEIKNSSRRSQSTELDHYVRPGSRRDPSKTNEAIRRDKEEKVKEHLAKSLDNVKPPGTELDDFCEDTTFVQKKMPPKKVEDHKNTAKKLDETRKNEGKRLEEPKRIDEHRRFEERIPFKDRRFRGSPQRFSPRRSPRHRFSPARRFSPRRFSPYRRSPRRRLQSKSPDRRRSKERRRSNDRRSSPDRRCSPNLRRRSPERRVSPDIKRKRDVKHSASMSDNFLYPKGPPAPQSPYPYPPAYPAGASAPNAGPTWEANPVKFAAFDYTPPAPQSVPVYSTSYPGAYEYVQPGPPGIAAPAPYAPPLCPVPQAVPAPAVVMPAPAAPCPVPTMVPAPMPSTGAKTNYQQPKNKSPLDALAQLLAEGKITKEDYLKLTPNKGAVPNTVVVDLKDKVELLSRCHNAVGKLSKLHLPNRLIVLNNIPSQEPKSISSKYCSPLKRQPMVEFQFTQPNPATLAQQNKQLIDNIAVVLGFDKLLNISPKKESSTTKDAAVQTTRPFCDVCEIRESTKYYEVATSTNHEYFTTSVHTQVVDHDLASSKSVFAPSGGMAQGAAMSIAHLTPAQLVSQLAAKAKTLKQSDPSSETYPNFGRRNPVNDYSNYEYDQGGNEFNNRGYRY